MAWSSDATTTETRDMGLKCHDVRRRQGPLINLYTSICYASWGWTAYPITLSMMPSLLYKYNKLIFIIFGNSSNLYPSGLIILDRLE